MLKKSRGRPLGFKLSSESKKAISKAKTGQQHSEETKEKISRTLMTYFRNIHPLSKELFEDYEELIKSDINVHKWYNDISTNYDSTNSVLTEKSLNSKRLREISIEYNIDMSENNYLDFFTNNPEKMYELKHLCEKLDINMNDVVTILDARADAFEEGKDGEER